MLQAAWSCVCAAVLSASPALSLAQSETVHHDLRVVLWPSERRLEVRDSIQLPTTWLADRNEIEFAVNAALTLESVDADVEVSWSDSSPRSGSAARRVRVRPRGDSWPDDGTIQLKYRGVIHDPLSFLPGEAASGSARSSGLIDPRGVVLSGSSWWVPMMGEELVTFELDVGFDGELPPGPAGTHWDVVSQGERTLHEPGRRATWRCAEPMDEIYLIAAPFAETSRPAGNAVASTYLRTPDTGLAARYLEATAQYLDLYQRLIGPYPYSKFALVENFWETGYGMPSFTLLGSQVIRLPFILNSSYPHEILHNWWGNSVLVDRSSGNWCEGLTTYLADHLLQEGLGKGEAYRRDTLKKYRNYVSGELDFPLREFRSRHSQATSAVGYGKSLMLFHMLRREIGDAAFRLGLQRIYRRYRYRRASYADLAKEFARAAERDLGGFFEQWVDWTGAPQLQLDKVITAAGSGQCLTTVQVKQVQPGKPYALSVPVAFTLPGRDETWVETLELIEREGELQVLLPGSPTRVELDPQFDLFRWLDRAEIPSSLSQLWGAEAVTVVLPSAGAIGADAWRTVAEPWFAGDPGGVDWVLDDELAELPADRAVWVLGSDNAWKRSFEAELELHGAGLGETTVSFGRESLARETHSFVYTARHPHHEELAIGWVGTDVVAALPGLSRKLPHYGKYSFLAFVGEEPSNVVKSQWPATGSPLVLELGNDGTTSSHPRREPLGRVAAVFDPSRLAAHVDQLDSWTTDEQRAEYIADQFRGAGLVPAADRGTFLARWDETGKSGLNVIGVVPGQRDAFAEQSVVVGVRFDERGGASNAAAVAVMLEVATLLGEQKPSRSLVFAAYSGDANRPLGALHDTRARSPLRVSAATSMIHLDDVGRLRGGKLDVLASGTATEWIHIAMGIGFTTGIESTCRPDQLGEGDHRAFHAVGVPAVQLRADDGSAGPVDHEGLVKIATWLREAVVYLVEREPALTSTLPPPNRRGTSEPVVEEKPEAATPPNRGRRASLGTLPDFGFSGPGVRVGSVRQGTAAATAGILAGDVLLAMDGVKLIDLAAYSALLKQRSPGDEVEIELRRGDETKTVKATLGAR